MGVSPFTVITIITIIIIINDIITIVTWMTGESAVHGFVLRRVQPERLRVRLFTIIIIIIIIIITTTTIIATTTIIITWVMENSMVIARCTASW